MTFQLSTLKADDGTSLALYHWSCPQPKAVVQIAHGMAEHAGRYDYLAQKLVAAGYEVYAHDHRGHGKTANAGDLGYFADHNGWNAVIGDMNTVGKYISAQLPDLPRVLLGHSMGSLLSRSYIFKYGDQLAGLVLSGTAGPAGVLGGVGMLIARSQRLIFGNRHRSKLLTKLSFGAYNKQFQPIRSEFDWLSRDPEQVAAYIADPKCGQIHTTGFYVDLLGGIAQINKAENIANVRSELPILLISGDA
ncbi:MAG: alpha/beta hydrolase, partial [Actinomycetales bacterium]